MAFINLAGTLLDPNSEFAVGDKVRFTHKSTTGETIQGAVSVLTIPPDGMYDIDLQFGLVLVEYKDVRKSHYENRGVATVNGTNPATSIPELLNALVPVSSAELIEFQAILADCVTAQTAAELAEAGAVIARNDAEAFAATLDLINDLSQAYEFATVSLAKATSITLPVKKVLELEEYSTGNGGKSTWNVITKGTTPNVDLPNGTWIRSFDNHPTLALKLQLQSDINVLQFGAIRGVDSGVAINAALAAVETQNLTNLSFKGNFLSSITIDFPDFQSDATIDLACSVTFTTILDVGVDLSGVKQGLALAGQMHLFCAGKVKDGYLIDDNSGLSFNELIVQDATFWGVHWGTTGNNNSARGKYIRATNCGTDGAEAFVKSSDVSPTSLTSQRSILTVAVPLDTWAVEIAGKIHTVQANSGTTIDVWPITAEASGSLDWFYGGNIAHDTSGDNNVAQIDMAVVSSAKGVGLYFDGVFGNHYSSVRCEAARIAIACGGTITHQSLGNLISHAYLESNEYDMIVINKDATVHITESILERATLHKVSSLFQEASDVAGLGRQNVYTSVGFQGAKIGGDSFIVDIVSGTSATVPAFMNVVLDDRGPVTSDYNLTLSFNIASIVNLESNIAYGLTIYFHGFETRNLIITPPAGFTIEGGATHTLASPANGSVRLEQIRGDYRVYG
ncbi:MAG TPA: hypothetical protein EYN67_12990 [Flavobacteriales bacterium]|nr:hypothetical protein [Flavobacteriales bacterium]